VITWENPRTGEIGQPVTSVQIAETVQEILEEESLSPRALRDLITD